MSAVRRVVVLLIAALLTFLWYTAVVNVTAEPAVHEDCMLYHIEPGWFPVGGSAEDGLFLIHSEIPNTVMYIPFDAMTQMSCQDAVRGLEATPNA